MEVQAITFNRSTRVNDRSDALIPRRRRLRRNFAEDRVYDIIVCQLWASGREKELKEIREGKMKRSFKALQLNSLEREADDGQISPQLPRKTHLSRAALRGRDRRLSDRYVSSRRRNNRTGIAAVSQNRRGRCTRAERDVVLGFYGFKLTEGRTVEAANCCCRFTACPIAQLARANGGNHRLVDFSNETNCFCGTDTMTCHLPAIRYRTSGAAPSKVSSQRHRGCLRTEFVYANTKLRKHTNSRESPNDFILTSRKSKWWFLVTKFDCLLTLRINIKSFWFFVDFCVFLKDVARIDPSIKLATRYFAKTSH